MADNYTGFTFNGISFDLDNPTYPCFIVNSGEDLKFSNAPEFSDEFTSPKLGNNSIFTGTTVGKRTISFTIMTNEITLDNYKSLLSALDFNTVGYFKFDYSHYFYYKVKVTSIGNGKFTPTRNGKYYVEFDISFVTVGDWAALELVDDTPASPGDEYYTYTQANTIPVYHQTFDLDINSVTGGYDILLQNKSNLPIYFTINTNDDIILYTDSGRTTIDKTISLSALGTYYSQFGFALNVDGEFISTSTQPIEILPNTIKYLKCEANFTIKIIGRTNL